MEANILTKQIEYKDIGWNVPFAIDIDAYTTARWAVKIDDVRFIYIGQNGALFPQEGMTFYVMR